MRFVADGRREDDRAAAKKGSVRGGGDGTMKFYTIKLPKFLGGFVKAILNTFYKN